MLNQQFKLPVGFKFGSDYFRTYELLRSNGVAEKVFANKLADRPYTWMGYVLSIGCKSIGGVSVGAECRAEYISSNGGITIPQVVLKTPFADVNTIMVEIHRNCWENILPQQLNSCTVCGKQFKQDIDLNRIKSPVVEEKEFNELAVTVASGFNFKSPGTPDKKAFPELDGVLFNHFVFRVPTLSDAIRYEAIADDGIVFWRKIAYDCLIRIESVDAREDGSISVVYSLDEAQKSAVGPKLFDDYLDRKDLASIRKLLRETLPTMEFFYEEECPCPQRKTIPVSMSSNSFFSE